MRHGLIALISYVGAVIALAISAPAAANILVIDFDSTPGAWGCCQNHNLTIDGLRISPVIHVDIFDFGDPNGWNFPGASVAMGWDSAGSSNPDYVGPACVAPNGTCVYIDWFGETFSFLSFSRGNQPIVIESSKGGLLQLDEPALIVESRTLSGPEWQDIEWILFSAGDPGAPVHFVDDLKFSFVPIPAAAWLLASALGVLGTARWKNAQTPHAPMRGIPQLPTARLCEGQLAD